MNRDALREAAAVSAYGYDNRSLPWKVGERNTSQQRHGTISRYRAGCRCDDCVTGARAVWRRNDERRASRLGASVSLSTSGRTLST